MIPMNSPSNIEIYWNQQQRVFPASEFRQKEKIMEVENRAWKDEFSLQNL